MYRPNPLVLMMTATYESGFQIDVNEFCGYSVRKGQILRCSRLNYLVSPFPMGIIHAFRQRKVVWVRNKVSHASNLKHFPSLLN